MTRQYILISRYLLQTLVLHFSFLARQRILQSRVVPRIDEQLAIFPEFTFARYREQRRVEERMVLSQIIFALISGMEIEKLDYGNPRNLGIIDMISIPSHLRLLPLSLQQLDV